MNICSPQLGLSPTSILGGEVYDREVLTRLAKWGHQIHLLLPHGKPHDQLKNFQVTFAPLKHIIPPHLYNLFLLPYTFRLAHQKKIDLFRIHVPEFFGPSAWLFKKTFPHIPVVGHYHLDEPGLVFNTINQLFLNSCDLVIADSHYLAKQIRRKFPLPKSKIKVIHCGADVDKIKPGKKDPILVKKHELENKKVILYLGLFIKRKNPAFLIKVFASLQQQYPHTKLIMIGKGPEEKRLKALAREFEVKQDVIFPGPQYNTDKLRYYQTADVFAFPSHNEGFVLSVLEAMAAGLPLVVSNSVSLPEAITNNRNGYLAKPNHLKDWLAKLAQLISNEKLRQTISRQARYRAVKQFSWQSCGQKVIKAYQKLIQ
jgi:glycosyltransferase involved in cell wall biosynthesis